MLEERLKKRLTGAVILVGMAIILIPIVLTGPLEREQILVKNIPEKPIVDFESNITSVVNHREQVLTEAKESEDTGSFISQDDHGNHVTSAGATIVEDLATGNNSESGTEPSLITVEEGNTQVDGNTGLSAWILQLGSFTSESNARSLNQKLRQAGYPAFVELVRKDPGNQITGYRVKVGPEIKRSDAQRLLKNIKNDLGLEGILISYP